MISAESAKGAEEQLESTVRAKAADASGTIRERELLRALRQAAEGSTT